MNSYISQDNGNFFYRMLVNFAINFIVFIHCFKLRWEVAFIEERYREIILNTIPNSLNKRTIFENIVNILNILFA